MLDTFVKRGHRWHSVGLIAVLAAVSATFTVPQVGAAPPADSPASTAASASTAATPSTAAEAANELPAGLNIAIGSRIRSDPRPWPGESASNAVDGDATSRWCPSTVGAYQLEIDLGRVRDLSGFGLTFSGAGSPSRFSVYYSTKRPTATFGAPDAQPHATASPRPRMSEYVVDAPIPGTYETRYLRGAVRARYLLLTAVAGHTGPSGSPNMHTICVNELRAFEPRPAKAANMWLGGDISTMLTTPTRRLDGVEMPLLDVLKVGGTNYARLRLWTTESGGPWTATLENVLAMARQIKAAGLGLMIDFHYRHTWADPGQQGVPPEWEGQDLEELSQTIHDYTKSVLEELAAQGTPADSVQIGNEITQGMLWPVGRLVPDPQTGTADYGPFTTLLKAGIAGAKAGNPAGHDLDIVLQIDRGGDPGMTRYFLDQMQRHSVEFDVLGLSYYPWWHGPFESMKANLKMLARMGVPVLIAENQFPWQPSGTWPNLTSNFGETLHGYPLTPAGQATYQRDLVSLVASLPDDLGVGVLYWNNNSAGTLGWFAPPDGEAQPVVFSYDIG